MSDTALNKLLGQGDDAAEAAFTPNPATGITPEQAALYVNIEDPTDPRIDWWDGANFVSTRGAAGSGTVTHTGTLTANALVIGNGTVDIKVTTTGTGILTALGNNVGSAGAPVTFNGAGGTPSSLTLTNATGLPVAALPTSAKTRAITFAIDGGGSVLTTGTKADVYVPYSCTITAATIVAAQSGSVVIDVKKVAFGSFPGSLTSIVASAPPTLSTAQTSQDTTLTGWTTSVTAGDVLEFSITSVTTITRLTLALTVTVA